MKSKKIRQWVLKITTYAEKLLHGLDTLDWPDNVKLMQRNWIGKSDGLRFTAPVKHTNLKIDTFSAHFETCFGDTFVAIAPDHPLLPTLLQGTPEAEAVHAFCNALLAKRADDKHADAQEPEGIFTGRYIEDPLGNGDLPIWVANYVLADYGTGIVKCSAHDERDFAFAKKYGIALTTVLFPEDSDLRKRVEDLEVCFTDTENGILNQPKRFAGMKAAAARDQIKAYCIAQGFAQTETRYRLRDWIFSRQRYWGEPIPLIHCRSCGVIPVPEADLPVTLPDVDSYQPTNSGESPLAAITAWVETTCPQCQGPAKRETNTMPQWAGSCWYFLRYPDAGSDDAPFSQKNVDYWLPVDFYVGGIEHAILHLLYARFYTKVLHDLGYLSFDEPFKKLFNQGMVCMKSEKTGKVEKMSKSKGNVVNPDDMLETFGSDALRLYMLFMGPPELDTEWQTESLKGTRLFLNRLWQYLTDPAHRVKKTNDVARAGQKRFHRFLQEYSERIAAHKVNTAVASCMAYLNDLQSNSYAFSDTMLRDFLTALSIMVPHFASELLERLLGTTLADCTWPVYDPALAAVDTVTIALQVNGKFRASLDIPKATPRETVEQQARALLLKWLETGTVVRVIFVPNKIMNFVIKKDAS